LRAPQVRIDSKGDYDMESKREENQPLGTRGGGDVVAKTAEERPAKKEEEQNDNSKND